MNIQKYTEKAQEAIVGAQRWPTARDIPKSRPSTCC